MSPTRQFGFYASFPILFWVVREKEAMSLDVLTIIVTIVLFLLGILGTLLGFFIKKTFFDPLRKVQTDIDKHAAECNEIPKSLILEKIDNLCEKTDAHQEYVKEMRKEHKDDIKGINDTLNIIISSQIKPVHLQPKYQESKIS